MSKLACHHGVVRGRGCSHLQLGNFGRLFPELPALYTHDSLIEALGKPNGLMYRGRSPDSDIDAGYTFFSQMVDHDITLDVQSQLDSDQVQNVEKLANFRSASLDLDCVYGFGPEATPHLYDNDNPGKLLTGTPDNPDDLARAPDGTALIGDPRNDENIFVNQMQNVFIKLHNRFIADGLDFEEAQRQNRFHYQYVVLHDFLKRVCDPDVYKFAVDRIYRHEYPLCYRANEHGSLAMPVEFSGAAYRFGHSMVRSKYTIKQIISGGAQRRKVIELFDDDFLTEGFTPIPPNIRVDWSLLLSIGGSSPSMSKAIDGKMAGELADLPFLDEPNPNKRSLAFRNLLRGRSLGLPSGQAVARALLECGYDISPEKLRLPKSQFPGIDKLSDKDRLALEQKAPLFFYILAEGGKRNSLGPTGSAILLEVFGAMLLHCHDTYLSADWSPIPAIAAGDHQLTLGDLVAYSNG